MALPHRVLMCGKNNIMIDEFYSNLSDSFDLLTSSVRYRDMVKHVELFKPALTLLVCQNLSDSDYKKAVGLQRVLEKYDSSFAILGSKEDCKLFQTETRLFPDLVLTKPITHKEMSLKIGDFIDRKITVAQSQERANAAASYNASGAARRKHVLVIDDDPLMLKLIKEYLHSEYDVATAVSGKIAYKFLENKTTDLILLDYEMPDENGPDVYLNLRTKGFNELPIVFLTGVTDTERVKEVLALQPQGYVLKPVDKNKLLNAVEGIIGK